MTDTSHDIAAFIRARLDEEAELVETIRSRPIGYIADERGEHRLIELFDPARVLRGINAKRRIIDEVLRWRHDYNDEDSWYSCSQATEPYGYGRDGSDEPGSGCANEDRAGASCDCGLDRRQRAILSPIASQWSHHEDYRTEWTSDLGTAAVRPRKSARPDQPVQGPD